MPFGSFPVDGDLHILGKITAGKGLVDYPLHHPRRGRMDACRYESRCFTKQIADSDMVAFLYDWIRRYTEMLRQRY